MSGYGVPPAAQPRSGRKPALPVFDLVAAGLSVLVFILAFVKWVGIDCDALPAEARSECEKIGYSGWDLPAGTAAAVLLLVAALLLVRPLLDSTAVPGSAVPALLAGLGGLLMVVQLITGAALGSAFSDVKESRQVTLFLVTVIALAEAGLAVVSWLQAAGRIRPRSAAPPAWSGASPGQPGQPGHPGQPGPDAGWPQGGYGQPTYGHQPVQQQGYGDGLFGNQGGRQGGYPEQGHPDQGYPERGHPDQGYPERGHPEQGYPERGHPEQGYPDQGQQYPPQGGGYPGADYPR